ncbi:MAG: glutamate--tRNA ligase [Aestuariivita sp.]|nr:glutamate--tRNA ligase [Aestuariivita sp.]
MTTTRFAPSPTGHLHVGNLRTALLNFLIARQSDGHFILRIDDTDPGRSQEIYVDSIKEDLEWLGLGWDQIERQSERLDAYLETASHLRNDERLYEAFETPGELELRRKKQRNRGHPPVYDRAALLLSEVEKDKLRAERGEGVWRFKLDRAWITWEDGILGSRSIDASSLSDPILIRRDGQFLYTLASVVDDMEMGISHVVRGADHITNTAVQIQIIKALGGQVPTFAHHSLLTDDAGYALAKRLGTLAIRDFKEQGIAPMAILSLLARLGTSEPVVLASCIDELVEGFDLTHFGSSPTKFDDTQLFQLTGRYLQTLPYTDVSEWIQDQVGVPDSIAETFWYATRNNITTLSDLKAWWTVFRDGAEPLIDPQDTDFVSQAIELLPNGPYDTDTWKTWTDAVQAKTGRKGRALFMPLRKALTGQGQGPDMSTIMPLLHRIKART